MSCASRFTFRFSSGTGKTLHWEEYAHLPAGRRVPRATSAGFIRQTARALAQNSLRNLSTVIPNLSWVLILKICSSYAEETSDKLCSPVSPRSKPTATIGKGTSWLSFSYFSMVTAEHWNAQLKRAGESNKNASWWSFELEALSLPWLRKAISGTRCCAYHLVARGTKF